MLLATLMILPLISVCALAEESSGAPDNDTFTVNIVCDGVGRESFVAYFNDIAISDDSYTGWENDTQLDIRVVATEGYKIVAAYFEAAESIELDASDSDFSGSFTPAVGSVYTLRVVTEATTAVKNTLTVESNVEVKVFDKNDLEITDNLSTAEFAEGDSVKVKFLVDNFDASKATLTVNGETVTPAEEYSFSIKKGENKVVFNYDLTVEPAPAELTVDSGNISYAVFVNDVEADSQNPLFYAGDTVKITFNVDGDFDPAKAFLLHDGKKKDMAGTSYTFTAADKNTIVFKYGDMPSATLAINGHGRDLTAIKYSVSVNGATVDHTTYEFKLGDEVTVDFEVTVEDLADAFLTVNNENVSVSGNVFTFTLNYETNVVVFGYGVVPVRFTLNGPGYFNVQKTSDSSHLGEIRNTNASGSMSKTLYLNKGENFKFTVNPALNYELSGDVIISEPERDKKDGVYYVIPSGETKISATFKAAAVTVPTYQVKINVHIGGNLTIGTQVIYGGTGSQVDLAEGQGIIMTVAPDEGYEIDRFIVGGVEVQLDNNSYTISGISADTTVDVYFKSDAEIDMSAAIGLDGVNWNADVITIDVSGNRPVKREVLSKIASLDKNSGKFVEFVGDAGIVYVPYGGVFSGTSEVLMINVTELRSGDFFANLSTAITEQEGIGTIFKAFSINITENMPSGSKIAFNLGNTFVNGYASLRTFDGYSFANVSDAIAASPSGFSAKYEYNNQPTLICIKEIPSDDNSETSVDKDVSVGDNSLSGGGDNDGSANKVIVIIIIALVAVAGAAALFIVKWRQEKF